MTSKAKGMDGFSGEYFSDITRGETIPYSFSFVDEMDNDSPINVEGWKVYLAYSLEKNCSGLLLEKVFLPEDAAAGIISGYVTDSDTMGLPVGIVYGSIKFIDQADNTYLIDKAKFKVHPCINPRIGQ